MASPPSEKELDALVEHVAHEMVALDAAAKLFCDTGGAALALDAFLLHARILREFYLERPHARFGDRAVLAEHFSPDWPARRDALPRGTLGRTQHLIDALLVHISRRRADRQFAADLSPDVPRLLGELQAAQHAFLATLQGNSTRWAFFQAALLERARFFGIPR